MRDAIGEQSIGCPRRRQSLATPTLQSERRLYVVVISPHLAHRARGDRHGDRRHHLPERLIGSLPFDVSLARDARKAKSAAQGCSAVRTNDTRRRRRADAAR